MKIWEHSFVVKGTPPSVNKAYYFVKTKVGRIIKVKTKKAKSWFEYVKDNCQVSPPVLLPVFGNNELLEIDLKFFFKDKRKHDVDNYQKLTLDAMTGLMWRDDNQIKKIVSEKFYDPQDPRTEIKIKKHEVNLHGFFETPIHKLSEKKYKKK